MHTLLLSFCQALLFIFSIGNSTFVESKYLDEILFVHHMCLCGGCIYVFMRVTMWAYTHVEARGRC